MSAVLRVLLLGLLATIAVRADDQAPKLSKDQALSLVSSLQWKTGSITLKDGLAKINLTDDFRFLDNADARKVLHQLWSNPDDPDILGMIFPKAKGPLDEDGWAVTVGYEQNGYVKDDDAEKINYTDLLKKMQDDAKAQDEERTKAGYPTLHIVGWAEPPRYDKAAHKLYWAKELEVGGDPNHQLNYDIRILGRRGVLVLSTLANLAQLPEVNEKTPEILSMVDFQPGNTYAEFDPKIDKVAEYGLATLIAGGALAGAAKLGLFGLLLKYIVVVALALKKALLVVVLGVVAGVKKLWATISGRKKTPDNLLPPGQS
jgi:uncharacterized membrane-anchored protein